MGSGDNCAVVLVGHLNKSPARRNFTEDLVVLIHGCRRSVMQIEKIEDGSSVRLLRHVKAVCLERELRLYLISVRMDVSDGCLMKQQKLPGSISFKIHMRWRPMRTINCRLQLM